MATAATMSRASKVGPMRFDAPIIKCKDRGRPTKVLNLTMAQAESKWFEVEVVDHHCRIHVLSYADGRLVTFAQDEKRASNKVRVKIKLATIIEFEGMSYRLQTQQVPNSLALGKSLVLKAIEVEPKEETRKMEDVKTAAAPAPAKAKGGKKATTKNATAKPPKPEASTVRVRTGNGKVFEGATLVAAVKAALASFKGIERVKVVTIHVGKGRTVKYDRNGEGWKLATPGAGADVPQAA